MGYPVLYDRELEVRLEAALHEILRSADKVNFYICNSGAFERLFLSVLRTMKRTYSWSKISVFLLYMRKDSEHEQTEFAGVDRLVAVPGWVQCHGQLVRFSIAHTDSALIYVYPDLPDGMRNALYHAQKLGRPTINVAPVEQTHELIAQQISILSSQEQQIYAALEEGALIGDVALRFHISVERVSRVRRKLTRGIVTALIERAKAPDA